MVTKYNYHFLLVMSSYHYYSLLLICVVFFLVSFDFDQIVGSGFEIESRKLSDSLLFPQCVLLLLGDVGVGLLGLRPSRWNTDICRRLSLILLVRVMLSFAFVGAFGVNSIFIRFR